MGVLNSPKGKDHALLVQVSKKFKSKEKQIVKKPKSESEDEDSYEDLMKKVKKKGRTSKFFIAARVLIQRISVSIIIWTSCLSFLRSTRSKFQMN